MKRKELNEGFTMLRVMFEKKFKGEDYLDNNQNELLASIMAAFYMIRFLEIEEQFIVDLKHYVEKAQQDKDPGEELDSPMELLRKKV